MKAHRHLKWSAEKGDNFSQHALGYLYQHGKVVDKNIDAAIVWYEKSVAQDNVYAQRDLAVIYFLDGYERQNFQKSFPLMLATAKRGDGLASFYLGLMYRQGKGVAKNDIEAFNWYQKSAALGVNDTQYDLAMMLFYGEGIDADKVKAKKWLMKAKSLGNNKAAEALGSLDF